MSDDTQRDKVKNHLDAAREWLGSASGALENREDIKSELDLMLAEAELVKAREMKARHDGDGSLGSRSRMIRLVRRYAPLLAALVVAAVWMRFSAVTVPVKPTPPTPPTVARPTVPQAAKPKTDRQESPAVGSGSGYTSGQPAGDTSEQDADGDRPTAPVPGEVTGGKQSKDEAGVDAEGQAEATATAGRTIPDASTQQMMLEAAKILRQTK